MDDFQVLEPKEGFVVDKTLGWPTGLCVEQFNQRMASVDALMKEFHEAGEIHDVVRMTGAAALLHIFLGDMVEKWSQNIVMMYVDQMPEPSLTNAEMVTSMVNTVYTQAQVDLLEKLHGEGFLLFNCEHRNNPEPASWPPWEIDLMNDNPDGS